MASEKEINRTRRIARPRNVVQCSGTKEALTVGREKPESRRVAAAKPRQRSADDAIMPGGHNIWRFLVMDRNALLQFGVLALGLLQDGDVGVGVFPEGEKIFVGDTCFAAVANHCISATELKTGKSADR